jgi:hypothetical protein
VTRFGGQVGSWPAAPPSLLWKGGEEGEVQSCAQQRRRPKPKGAAAAVSFVSAFRVLAALNYFFS